VLDIDELVADLLDASSADERRERLERLVAAPAEAVAAFRPHRAEILTLHRSSALTIMNVVWAPGMRFPPHDHRTWGTIAVYAGREDNRFYRRHDPGSAALAPSGGATLAAGEVADFDDQIIHSVHNPSVGFTAAVHVYGGDYPSLQRSLWDDDATNERPSNSAESAAIFDRANDAPT
jgi:predicted metal-dependent enzyme (double-stranded beta helix superfamily)